MSERPVLGELIRDRRVALGLTQVDLSQRTGLAQRAISDIERGVTRRPSQTNLRIISKALDLNYVQLVIASEKATAKEAAQLAEEYSAETMTNPLETALLWEFRQLSETNQQLAASQVRAMREWQVANLKCQLGTCEEGEQE